MQQDKKPNTDDSYDPKDSDYARIRRGESTKPAPADNERTHEHEKRRRGYSKE
jgi:hypothetical protein